MIPFHDNYQKSLNKGLLLTGPGSYTVQLEPHIEFKGRESLRSWVWDSAFIRVEGGGLGFCWLTLNWWI